MATCCIKYGFGFDILPWNTFKCCYRCRQQIKSLLSRTKATCCIKKGFGFDILPLKLCSPVPFVFIILSCWMSSSNNIIWIFISFVGLIAIVSGNRLNFFDGYQFSHLKIFVSTLIRTTFFRSFLFSWWVFKIPL